MTPDGIVEPVNVAGDGLDRLLPGVEDGPPDKLGFQRLEERFDHRVVVAVSLAGHRDQDSALIEAVMAAFAETAPGAVARMGGVEGLIARSRMTAVGPIPRLTVEEWLAMALDSSTGAL
jgi:hypothetical protein